jgi:hypothetical protein
VYKVALKLAHQVFDKNTWSDFEIVFKENLVNYTPSVCNYSLIFVQTLKPRTLRAHYQASFSHYGA